MKDPEGKNLLRIIPEDFLWPPHKFIHIHTETPTYMNTKKHTYKNTFAQYILTKSQIIRKNVNVKY